MFHLEIKSVLGGIMVLTYAMAELAVRAFHLYKQEGKSVRLSINGNTILEHLWH